MRTPAVRGDFPILSRFIDGKPLVYLDNACMSLKPRAVMEAMEKYYQTMGACAGRSNHRLAREVTVAVEKTRALVAKHIGAAEASEVLFVRNTTEGINLVARTLDWHEGDVVLTSGKEHNSNLVPWLQLAKAGTLVHQVVPLADDNTWDMAAFERTLTTRVKLVAVAATSNLDGVSFPIEEIVQKAHRAGAKVLVDGAQALPHSPMNVNKVDCDFLAFSGHKMLGPTGTGILYGKKKWLQAMEGFLVGGDTVAWTTYTDYELLGVPEKFEAGLQDYAGIIGLGAAIEYLRRINPKEIAAYERSLNEVATGGLSQLDRVTILGPEDPGARSGIVSFTVDGVDPHQVALMLDNAYGIMVRSGQHCAHSWFADHELNGSVRASFYIYNTIEEAEYLVESMQQILKVI